MTCVGGSVACADEIKPDEATESRTGCSGGCTRRGDVDLVLHCCRARAVAGDSDATGAAVANATIVLFDGPGPALARVVTGAFLAAVYPSALKAMSGWFWTGRGLALGVTIGAVTIGSALPHLINALGVLEWRATLLIASGLTFVGGVIARRECTAGPYTPSLATFDPAQLRAFVGNREFRLASAGYFGLAPAVLSTPGSYSPCSRSSSYRLSVTLTAGAGHSSSLPPAQSSAPGQCVPSESDCPPRPSEARTNRIRQPVLLNRTIDTDPFGPAR